MSLNNENLFNSTIQTLLSIYNTEKENYISTISSLNQKITSLTKENESLQNQKLLYISQIAQLKQQLHSFHNCSQDNECCDDDSMTYNNTSLNKPTTPFISNQHNNTSHMNPSVKRSPSPMIKDQIICKDKDTTTSLNKTVTNINTKYKEKELYITIILRRKMLW